MDTARQKWLFYVASSAKYGGGHMSRSMELARQMQYLSNPVFVLESCANWKNQLEQFDLVYTTPDNLETNIMYDGLWVDHYSPDVGIIKLLKQCTRISCALIDMPEQNTDFDLCVSYVDFLSRENTLSGFEYALINSDYAKIPLNSKKTQDILIAFGQTDAKNTTSKALNMLEQYDGRLSLGVVCGKYNRHKTSIQQKVQHSKHSITLIEGETTLINSMSDSKVYIGSGGVSMLEACAAGLACGIITTAHNQHIQTQALQKEKAVIWLGDSEDLDSGQCLKGIEMLVQPQTQERLSACGKSLIDVKSSARLANHLLGLRGRSAF